MSKIEEKQEFIKNEFQKYIDNNLSNEYRINFTFEDNNCEIYFEKEYNGIEDMVSFETILFLSKILGTSKININDEDFTGGCETCDYGSRHRATFICKDIKI